MDISTLPICDMLDTRSLLLGLLIQLPIAVFALGLLYYSVFGTRAAIENIRRFGRTGYWGRFFREIKYPSIVIRITWFILGFVLFMYFGTGIGIVGLCIFYKVLAIF